MELNRRGFAGRAALALALGLQPDLLWAADATPDYLANALAAARWIEASGQTDKTGAVRWPADPLKPEALSPALYGGSAGVVAFYTALGRYGGGDAWLTLARRGAEGLIADARDPALDNGLYTGRAGLVHVLADLHRVTGETRWRDAAQAIAVDIAAAARPAPGGGVDWSDSPDIVSGGAGIALTLLRYGKLWNDPRLIQVASQAGQALIAAARPAEGGLWWSVDRTGERNFPNFSHGTAGVAYFLAQLHRQTGTAEPLRAAIGGATYLDAVATRRDGGALIFHRADGGLDRFYVGWCHGPVGTVRLFHVLHQITGQARWNTVADELSRGLAKTGAPLVRSEGYWNTVGQCCGSAGIAQHHIDLIRYRPGETTRAVIDPILTDVLARATRSNRTLSWVQSEHRVQPDNLVAQTGLMQGAAGIGLLFLQLKALDAGQDWILPLPDTPFAPRTLA